MVDEECIGPSLRSDDKALPCATRAGLGVESEIQGHMLLSPYFGRAGMDFLGGRLSGHGGGVLIGAPSGQVGAACDQARAAFVGDVGPSPLNENQEPVAKTDEKKNVDKQPR